jgi:hypothetical protein
MWFDVGGGVCLERAFWAAASDVAPPPNAKDAVWSALAATIAVPVAAQPGAGSTVTSGSVKAIVAGSILVVAAGIAAYPRSQPASLRPGVFDVPPQAEPRASVPVAAETTHPVPRAVASSNPVPSSTATSRAARDLPQATAPNSTLAEEARLLRDARRALRDGDPRRAIALVQQSRERFPRGALGQEADAIHIEALARLGARTEAARRLADFERRYPGSPHAARLHGQLD